MRYVLLCALALSLTNCTKSNKTNLVTGELNSDTILVAGLKDKEALSSEARSMGLDVSGKTVLTISGPREKLSQLKISIDENPVFIEDQPIKLEPHEALTEPDQKIYYLAQKEFGLPEFLRSNPEADGRNVVVGVVDDGISPHTIGFQKTTTGERKILKKGWESTALDRVLAEVTNPNDASEFLRSVPLSYTRAYQNEIDEKALVVAPYDSSARTPDEVIKGYLDLNGDNRASRIALTVIETQGGFKACIDADASGRYNDGECFGLFSVTGEYGYWTANKKISFVAEFNPEDKKLRFSTGELPGDLHGEGVASVLAGHNIGGLFDGVAPGAKILDYDLSVFSTVPNERTYTIGTFVRALEWLGENGAEVINISYSVFFESAAAQDFSRAALQDLVNKYKYVVSFSAGNNGPGLGSLNRRNMYPKGSLVAGAYVSKELDEYVHGVTGLPDEGRVVYYSSRGPGPDGGRGPTVISPLASLTHADPTSGYIAFNGTSSASPALAGLATILISTAKLRGWPIDNETVVDAIRLSATPLPGVPFIDQGAGLPKIQKAVEFYELLISGKQFSSLETTTQAGFACADGVACTGYLIRLSGVSETESEILLSQKGIVSKSAPADRGELLRPVLVKYNAPWLSGPERSWVGENSVSRINVKIDFAAARRLARPGAELNGEVTFYDTETGLKLHTVPVTLINDLTSAFQAVANPSAEEGTRIHFTTDARAVRVKVDVIEGRKNLISYRVYDPNGVAILNQGGTDEFVFATTRAGSYQIAPMRPYGSSAKAAVLLSVEPVELRLATEVITGNRIVVENFSKQLDGVIQLRKAPETIVSNISGVDTNGEWVVAADISKEGSYSVRTIPAVTPEVSYAVPTCYAYFTAPGEAPIVFSAEEFLLPKDKSGRLECHCRPFEHTGSKWRDTLRKNEIQWKPPGYKSAVADLSVRLKPGRNELSLRTLSPMNPGDEYEVWLQALFGSGSVYLGKVRNIQSY